MKRSGPEGTLDLGTLDPQWRGHRGGRGRRGLGRSGAPGAGPAGQGPEQAGQVPPASEPQTNVGVNATLSAPPLGAQSNRGYRQERPDGDGGPRRRGGPRGDEPNASVAD